MKRYKLIINGEKYEAKVLSYKGNEAKVNVNGIDYVIEIEQEDKTLSQPVIQTSKSISGPDNVTTGSSKLTSGKLSAPIPGVILRVYKNKGDFVNSGDILLTLEAMKMESDLLAPISGKITELNVSKGDTVQEGDLLVIISSSTESKTPKKETLAPISQPSSPARRAQNVREPRLVQHGADDGMIKAPIPGTVIDVKVKEGDRVFPDDVVVILEAMKMESEIRAGIEGTVKEIMVSKGNSVNEGDLMLKIGE